MALVDMKVTKAEAKAKEAQYQVCEGTIGGSDGDRYPYGLELRLDNDSLKKLGITNLPKVGGKMTLTAQVIVEEARESQRRSGTADRSVTLQITKMDLAKGTGNAASAADALSEALDK